MDTALQDYQVILINKNLEDSAIIDQQIKHQSVL